MSLTSDNSFNNEYDYSDDIYEESMWSTTSFCADPLLTYSPNSTFPSISNCLQHAILDQLAPLLLLISLPILWITLSNAKIEYKATKEEEEEEEEIGRAPHSEIELIKKVCTG
ncbi:unnamed protein product [Meloidogyne enterolobii]|uniref:Uncharacterized protein n=1 Tax=Meloidogyne enterolobii TaxID=390850 RepID=A0ACB1A8C8_MELEN